MTKEQIEILVQRLHRMKCYDKTVDEFKGDIMALINWIEFGCNED